jgi:glycosyltransferase involved in cell wall biosynthesis
MALERAVVSSDLDALREVVIHEKTGLTVEPKNPSALAKAVLRLLNDKELSSELAKNARKLVKSRYSYKYMLDRLEELYRRIY